MKNFKTSLITCLLLCMATVASAQTKLRLVVAGLTHDHVHGILNQYHEGTANVVGIAEPDRKLWKKYEALYKIPESLFYPDLAALVKLKKPDAVLGYNAVALHVNIVEVCAPLGIPVMVEKPLAATLEQAKRIEALSNKYHVAVLTNYETTWYPSYQHVYDLVNADSVGTVRKIVVHDGHKGPREIGCSEDFLNWLTDPVLNGAGALNDFGCYGADLMTWLMHGQRPIAVTAIARHYKPAIYPKVEDDATVIVEYANATGLIEASWNWPFNIKDMEVFGKTGYLHAFDRDNVQVRLHEDNSVMMRASPLAAPLDNSTPYLTAVLQKTYTPVDDQSSLKYNMIVMEILDAAKRSIKEGKRIVLGDTVSTNKFFSVKHITFVAV